MAITLEQVLGKDKEELTALKTSEFYAEKLNGDILYTEIEADEHKQNKRDSTHMVQDGTGGMVSDIDEDKLMIKVIITAVNKDKRSDFTFADKRLLAHLGVSTAEGAVKKLLSIGDIYNFATAIQNISGFGTKQEKKDKEDVKN